MKLSTSRSQRFGGLFIEQTIVSAVSLFYHNPLILAVTDIPLVLIFLKLIDWGKEYQEIMVIGDKPE